MFRNRPRQRVLNRNHRTVHRPPPHAVKDLQRTSARHNRRPRQHSLRRFVTERAELSLNRNLHQSLSPFNRFISVVGLSFSCKVLIVDEIRRRHRFTSSGKLDPTSTLGGAADNLPALKTRNLLSI